MEYSAAECAFNKGWTLVRSKNIKGDGVTAPGAVTLCRIDGHHPFVIHFFNAQDGGFHEGDYCENFFAALEAYAKRVQRFTGK